MVQEAIFGPKLRLELDDLIMPAGKLDYWVSFLLSTGQEFYLFFGAFKADRDLFSRLFDMPREYSLILPLQQRWDCTAFKSSLKRS